MQALNVAILGATGLVGSHLISILEERQFPVKKLVPLASIRSAGQQIQFNGSILAVEEATPEAFEGIDLVLASAGGDISQRLVPEAVKRGAVVVDNTSCFRMQPNVPLVVAGVNNQALKTHQGIIANPNCSTAQLMPILQALHQHAGLKRVIVSTYQSVSGAGLENMQALLAQAKADLGSLSEKDYTVPAIPTLQSDRFVRPMAFNLIPHIDQFASDTLAGEGYTKEELKLIHETRKILTLPNLPITATAVRVPVLIGHSESVTVDLEQPLSPEEAITLLSKVPNVVVGQTPTEYPTPREIAGQDPVYVGRIRRDTSNLETGLNFWVVADNLRIGAALNAVRIAEVLLENQWLKQTSTISSV